MANLYIASYEVSLGAYHSYLVLDNDEDLSTSIDQQIIRGGPSLLLTGKIEYELGESSALSMDGLDNPARWDQNGDSVQDSYTDRDYTAYSTMDSSLWGNLVSYTWELQSLPSNLAHDYATLGIGQNSNSVINTILNLAGLNMWNHLPSAHTLQGHVYTGMTYLLDSQNDHSYTSYANYNSLISDYNTNIFLRAGGADKITVQHAANTSVFGKLLVRNENDAVGNTTVFFENLDLGDVTFNDSGDDLLVQHGATTITLFEDYFSDRVDDFAEGAETTTLEFEDSFFKLGNENSNTLEVFNSPKSVFFRGEAGDDYLFGGASTDTLYGGNDNDHIYGSKGGDHLYGDAGNDWLYGEYGNDTLTGGAGVDVLTGGEGNDIFIGQSTGSGLAGDIYIGDEANTTFGFDNTMNYTGVNHMLDVHIDTVTVTAISQKLDDAGDFGDGKVTSGNVEAAYEVRTFVLGGSDDLVTMEGERIWDFNINAGYGGSGDNDTLILRGDRDLSYSNFSKNLTGFENVKLEGEYIALSPNGGFDEYVAASGYVNLDYGVTGSGLSYSLEDDTVEVSDGSFTDIIHHGEVLTIIGGDAGGSWSFDGAGEYNGLKLWSGTGDDHFNHSTNKDATGTTIYYTGGDDTIDANGYYLVLGPDIDTSDVSYSILNYSVISEVYDSSSVLLSGRYQFELLLDVAGRGSVKLDYKTVYSGTGGSSVSYVEEGANTIKLWDGGEVTLDPNSASSPQFLINNTSAPTSSQTRYLIGTNDDDTLAGVRVLGRNGNDVLSGIAGEFNTLKGGNGTDTLTGKNLYDSLNGGGGNDTLISTNGGDSLTGSFGSDTFVFEIVPSLSDRPTVEDFRWGEGDRLDVKALVFNFNSKSSVLDYVNLSGSGRDAILQIDTNGGGDNFEDVALIKNGRDLDVMTLYLNSSLILA